MLLNLFINLQKDTQRRSEYRRPHRAERGVDQSVINGKDSEGVHNDLS